MDRETKTGSSFLNRKHILIDTCILARAKDFRKHFLNLFEYFNEVNCTTVIHPLIVNEFLRGSQTLSYIDKKKEFLNQFSLLSLPITPDIIEDSILLSNLYSNKGIHDNQISIVDCINAAFLKKYKDLYLITLDYNDCPLIIFDRVYIHTLDLGTNIANCVFCRFNQSKFDQILIDFQKTKNI